MAVGKHLGSHDAVHDHHTVRSQHRQDLLHDVLKATPMPANDDGIRTGKFADVC